MLVSVTGCGPKRVAPFVSEQSQLLLTPREQLSPSVLPIALKEENGISGKDSERPRVALVLGSGGTRGIAHIGVLRALRQHGIPVDLVVGCSAGSLVGALFCSGMEQDKMERIALTSRRKDIFGYVISMNGVIDGARCESFLIEHIGRLRFGQLDTPFAVICTDVETGEEIVISRGDVARAVRASCTFPGLVIPMRVDGRLLVDGGVVDKLPVTVAKKLGADVVIAVDVSAGISGTRVTSAVDVLVQTINIMGKEITKSELRLADVVIRPDVGEVWMLDFRDGKKCIDAGMEAATAAIPAIRRALEQKGSGKEAATR